MRRASGQGDAQRFQAGVAGRCWTELEAAFLEQHHDALVFFSPASMPDYLPAYVAAYVDHAPDLDMIPEFLRGVLTRSSDAEIGRAHV